jgi:hypothetical protein
MPAIVPMAPILAEAAVGAAGRYALVATMVAGTLLLLAGARLLRPAVVLAVMLAGFVLAVLGARAFVPGLPLWIAAAAGAVLGLLVGALLYRPAVATVAAAVGATVGALVAWTVVSGGSLDTQPRELGHALVSSPREAPTPGDGERAGMRILSVIAEPSEPPPHRTNDAASAAAGDAADAAVPVGDRLLHQAADVAGRATDRARASVAGIAPAYRTLFLACIAAGAAIGFLGGLVATTLVARILTSFAGAWLLLTGLLPLLALHGLEPMPADARVWLVVLAVLALVGVVAQAKLGMSTAPAPKAKPRPPAKPAAEPA